MILGSCDFISGILVIFISISSTFADSIKNTALKLDDALLLKTETDLKKQIFDELVNDIRKGNVIAAANRFKNVPDDSERNLIVKHVNKDDYGFMRLKNLGNTLSRLDANVSCILQLYKSVWGSIESDDPMRNAKSMPLIYIIKEQFVDSAGVDPVLKADAASLILDIEESVVEDGKKILKNAFLNDDYKNGLLPLIVHGYNAKLFRKLLKETLDDIYPKMSISQLLKDIRSHENIGLRISGICVLYEKMKENGDLRAVETFDLALEIREIQEMETYRVLHEEVRSNLEKVKQGLPSVVKAIVFGRSI